MAKRNNAVAIKRKRNSITVDTRHADIVEVQVAAVNEHGGLEVTQFRKSKDGDSIKRISMAKDKNYEQNAKSKNGVYHQERKEKERQEREKKQKKKSWWPFGKKKGK